jgi:hypothetical protein
MKQASAHPDRPPHPCCLKKSLYRALPPPCCPPSILHCACLPHSVSTVSLARTATSARCSHSTHAPPSQQASTTDAPTSRRGEELHVTPPYQRVAHVAATLGSFMRRCWPPRRRQTSQRWASIHASIKVTLCWKRMLKEYVSSVLDVSEVCCKCFISMLQK